MPINVPNDLPAISQLEKENIFVMGEERSTHQDIRPLDILLVNLMPTALPMAIPVRHQAKVTIPIISAAANTFNAS